MRHVGLALTVLILLAQPCSAAVIFVDNLHGDDANNGRSERPQSFRTGPVRTIRRGLECAEHGDVLNLANHGIPYHEPISLTGRRHSGFPTVNFILEGNGSVIDGARPVPPTAWKKIEGNLWRMTPWRKGHYVLLSGEDLIPEFRIADAAQQFPAVPAGQWASWRGSIYYHLPEFEEPAFLPLRYAQSGVGLTLYDVENVTVRNVTFQHFRLDGVNAHDRCRNVVLENVRCLGNGRAGVAVAGVSDVTLVGCQLMDNLRHSVLITEKGAAMIAPEAANELDQAPTLGP